MLKFRPDKSICGICRKGGNLTHDPRTYGYVFTDNGQDK